jgi:hypothetical protein
MCITDAFSKFAELIAIPDKCAETVAEALFSRWLCEIVSDQGKEFSNEIGDKLLTLLKIKNKLLLPDTTPRLTLN